MSRTMPPNGAEREISTRLCSAVADGDIKSVETILSSDGSSVNCPSVDGHLPLELAAFWAHMDILKLLIQKGADINLTNRRDGSTALHAAAMQNHGPIVKYLLINCKPPADMSIKDKHGRSPADYASSSDVVWSIFRFAGCTAPRRTRAELERLGIQVDLSSSQGRSLQLIDRNTTTSSNPADAKADKLALAFGDVLAGTAD